MRMTVAYYRSSTKLQENSIDTQRDRAHTYAREHVVAIHKEYIDDGKSARKTKVSERQGMTELIEAIRAGQVGTVLVYKRDRLARNAVEYMEFYRLCRKHDVEIRFTARNEFPVYYTPLGEFIELIMAGMVQHEAEQIAERLSNTHLKNFLERKTIAPSLPYGLKKVNRDGKAAIAYVNESVRRDIATIYRAFIEMKPQTMKEFEDYLRDHLKLIRQPWEPKKGKDRKSMKRKSRGPRPWKSQEIINLITNSIYMGIHRRTFAGETYTVDRREECEPAVTESEWLEANKLIARFLPIRRENPIYTFLLEHIIVCKDCGKSLKCEIRYHNNHPIPKYECKDHKLALSAESCHQQVLNLVMEHIDQLLKVHGEDLYRRYQLKRMRRLENEITLVKNTISRLEKDFVRSVSDQLRRDSDFTDPTIVAPLNRLQCRLDEERRKLNDLIRRQKDCSLLPHIIKNRERRLMQLREIVCQELNKQRVKELLEDIVLEVRATRKDIMVVMKQPFREVEDNACS
jgi:site-specific DNA recombinase